MNCERLKARQRAERHDWPENLGLRVHRALSWMHRAEQLEQGEDPDGQFILLWIAFNAAYATRRREEAVRCAGVDGVSEEHPCAA